MNYGMISGLEQNLFNGLEVILLQILEIEIKLYVPWVQSLKEKRMIVKRIIGKIQNKFNISVAEIIQDNYLEIAEQDMVQTSVKNYELFRENIDIFLSNIIVI